MPVYCGHDSLVDAGGQHCARYSEEMDWRAVYEVLDERFEIGSWWPAESGFEVMVGAVLTQNTTWTSVEKAVERLRQAQLLTPEAVLSCPSAELVEHIHAAGSYMRKAATLKALAAWLTEHGEKAGAMPDTALRESLLAVNGVGPETADVICLYVYNRPVFIFDTYARRMIEALGVPVGRTYEGTRRLHQASISKLGLSAQQHRRFHGLIVTAGKHARAVGWVEAFGSGLQAG